MSKTEILSELPKLSLEDRQEVRLLLARLDVDEWLDVGELSDDDKQLIDQRLDQCQLNPGSFIPWQEAKRRILDGIKQ